MAYVSRRQSEVGVRQGRTRSSDGRVAGQRRHRPDYLIVLFSGILVLLGLVVLYAIGPQRSNALNGLTGTDLYSTNYFVWKQIVSIVIAVGSFVLMASLPFDWLKKHSVGLLQLGFGLCVLLFIAGNIMHIDQIATNTLGAYRWFNLGPLGSFQPSEFLKFVILIYVAGFIGKRYGEGKINDLKATVYPVLAVAAAALFIIVVLEKDMGTGISLAAVVFTILFVSKIKLSILAKIAGVGLALGVLMIVIAPHRMERVATFFGVTQSTDSAVASQDNNDYHIRNAMIALGSGGLLGRGIGQSVQATGYLPEAVNDSIFAIMGEVFGFIGTTVIIGLFAGLLLRLLRVVDRLQDMPMRLVVAGIFGWLVSHVFMNIASMTGLAPLTGITLPLLSFGGTSMVFMAGALGLVFQLSRYTVHLGSKGMEAGYEDIGSRRRVWGSHYSSRRRSESNL